MKKPIAIFCGELKSDALREVLNENYDLRCFTNNDEFYRATKLHFASVEIILLTVDSVFDINLLRRMPSLLKLISLTTSLTHINPDAQKLLMNEGKLITLRDFWDQMAEVTGAADLALMLILMGARRASLASLKSANNPFIRNSEFLTHEFSALRIGIIGYGRIGQRVGKYLKGLGISYSVYDPNLKDVSNVIQHKRIEDCLNSVHGVLLSSSFETTSKQILSKSLLIDKLNNSELFIVNISRGELVSEEQLIECALESKISCYLTDVVSSEFKIKMKTKFLSKNLDQLIAEGKLFVMPHIGGYTYESTEKTQKIIYRYLKGFLYK